MWGFFVDSYFQLTGVSHNNSFYLYNPESVQLKNYIHLHNMVTNTIA